MTDLSNEAKRLELVQRYLNAETTIEEERLLYDYYMHTQNACTPEEEDIRLILVAVNAHPHHEISEQKEKEFDQLMLSFKRQDEKHISYRKWLYPFASAIAASLLLLLTLHHQTEKVEQTVVAKQLVKEQMTQQLPSYEGENSHVEDSRSETSDQQSKSETKKKQTRHHETRENEIPIPDTLGNGIWKSEENVLTALQMLADCETTIEREEQELRNEIIQVTFRTTPQPTGVRLVSNEAGDYEVIDPQTIINL